MFPIPDSLPYEVRKEDWGKDPDLTTDITIEQANAYLTMWIVNAQFRRYRGKDLWNDFQEWFEGWGESQFSKANRQAVKLVREYLVLHGIQVRRGTGVGYTKAISELIGKDSPDPITDIVREDSEKLQSQFPDLHMIGTDQSITRTTNPPEDPIRTSATRTTSLPIRQTIENREGYYTPTPERTRPALYASDIKQSYPAFTPMRNTSEIEIEPARETTSYDRNLLPNLMKIYNSPEFKYGGDEYDFLNQKLQIFYDLCSKVGIVQSGYDKAFSIMLKDKAQAFYFDKIIGRNLKFEDMLYLVRTHFETEERYQKYLTEWRNTTFPAIIRKNPEKPLTEQLELLFERLRTLQLGLSDSYQTELALRDQVINACRNIPECSQALFRPSISYEGLCAELRNAVAQAVRTKTISSFVSNEITNDLPGTEIHWTDRTYGGRGTYRGRGQFRGRSRGRTTRGSYTQRPQYPRNSSRTDQKCYICKKPGCWSTNHSAEERKAKFEQFMTENDMNDDQFHQFLVSYEGDPDIEDETEEQLNEEDYDATENQVVKFDSYFTEIGQINGMYVAELLGRQSLVHAFLQQDQLKQSYEEIQEPTEIFQFEDRYTASIFQGIIPDTGASGVSTAGQLQVQALGKQNQKAILRRTKGNEHQIKFGKGSVISQGDVTVRTPLGDITFHIVPTNTPFLMCIQDMDRLLVTLDNLANVLRQDEKTIPIVRKWGHPFMLLNIEENATYNHLTEIELRQIHRRFGHPSVRKLTEVLDRAGYSDIDSSTIEKLNKVCKHCQLHTKSPGRFKFSIKDDIEFNYSIILDIFYLDGKPVLHIVDEATAYNAAQFVRDMTAKTVWNAVRKCWIDTYLGPPDHISHDAGTNFASHEFQQNAKSFQIDVREVPVEAHNAIGKVERFHAPIRRAYEIFKTELQAENLDKESILQMAVKAVNDTAGPNGLVPTLLVFGAYPRITSYDPPSQTIEKRAQAYRTAMKELKEIQAKRSIQDALASRNGPDTYETLNLPLNSLVRVWRERKGWTGPYRLLAISNQSCTVELPHGPTNFRSTVVKPFYEDPYEKDTKKLTETSATSETQITRPQTRTTLRVEIPAIAEPPEISDEHNQLITTTKDKQELSETFITKKEQEALELAIELRTKGVITTDGKPFEQSQMQEIDSLIARDVFEFVKYNPLIHTGRLFNSRLVNEVKGRTTDSPYEKSRLVIQAYNDIGKETILTQAPTIQRSSQRIIIALAPTLAFMGIRLMVRDVTQAYVQSKTPLNRVVLAKLPRELRSKYSDDTIMIVKKPLYGIAEAGTHWWATYWKHHQEKLNMITSTYDPCLLITNSKNEQFGIVGMQTDDTLILANQRFLDLEDSELKAAKLLAKPGEYLTYETPLVFNGCILKAENDDIVLVQKGQGKKIELVKDQDSYREQRARGAYIATICQPEASYDLSVAAQHQEPTDESIKLLNKRLNWQMKNQDRGLRFIPLDISRMKLFVFVDGSFANNKDLSSQIGYIIVLANEEISDENAFELKGNIIHYSSTKSKRVTRSVLASEIYGMVAGVDIGLAIRSTLNIITFQLDIPEIPVVVCTDSYSLYECLVKLGTTKEKRLMIDIMALRQSYERRELTEVRWVNGNDNMADAMTKSEPNKALEKFVDTNTAFVRVEGWVKREISTKID